MGILIEKGMKILFQGDSITDSGRKDDTDHGLGRGYPFLAAAYYRGMRPDLNLEFLNRGVSGNRTNDLVSRWDEDCVALAPDILSILIGINNTWRRYDRDDPTSPETFRNEYDAILKRSAEETGASLVICEPFILDIDEKATKMREDLEPKKAVCRELAEKYDAVYVPLDSLFAEACGSTDPAYWSDDGVHPTLAGHSFIANEWIKAVSGS
ncbi:MAG: SGNH/GDSL hydrolase family protein [Spirochaetia bacterium]